MKNFLILLGAFLIFLFVLLPQVFHYHYFRDDFKTFQHLEQLSNDPMAAWAPDSTSYRRHPLQPYLFFLEKSLFGPSPAGYFAVIYFFHFCNALLAVQLCRKLGGRFLAALLSGLFFLYSSSAYQNLVAINSTDRFICLLFFLLATLEWVDFLESKDKLRFLKAILFQTLALLSAEDAISFPLLVLFFAWRLAPKGKERNRILYGYLPLLIISSGLVSGLLLTSFFRSPARADLISTPQGAILAEKFVNFFEALFRPVFIPEKGMLPPGPLPENFLRLLPLMVILLVGGFLFKEKGTRRLWKKMPRPILGMGLAWMAITALPYLPHPLTFEHVTRYLYFPLVGFSVIFGSFLSGLFETVQKENVKGGFVFGLCLAGYVLVLNLYSNAYHLQRYQNYLGENPEEDYTEQARELLSTANATSLLTSITHVKKKFSSFSKKDGNAEDRNGINQKTEDTAR